MSRYILPRMGRPRIQQKWRGRYEEGFLGYAPSVIIPITPRHSVVVSECDYDLVIEHEWRITHPHPNLYYAITARKPGVMMHRVILDLSRSDPRVDHINHNGLDNRRENLRLVTASQNMANQRKTTRPTSSRFQGVYYHGINPAKPWLAAIRFAGKRHHLGLFPSEVEAAKAYNNAKLSLCGDYGHLNII